MNLKKPQASARKVSGIAVEQTANSMLTFLCFTNPLLTAILSVVGFDFHCPLQEAVCLGGTIASGKTQPPRASQRGYFLLFPRCGTVLDLNRHWRINNFVFSEVTKVI